MDLIAEGGEPAKTNATELFPTLWELTNEDQKKTLGVKYHTLMIDPDSDDSPDNGAKTRVFELLVQLNGVSYIPSGTRARIFRRAAQKLAAAKNTSYGWSAEESASINLLQLGTSVPSVAFEEVYQEILTIWCGNYWGSSESEPHLRPFIESLNTDKLRIIMRMFRENDRVQEELFNSKPKRRALKLLRSFEDRLTLEAHLQELRETVEFVEGL